MIKKIMELIEESDKEVGDAIKQKYARQCRNLERCLPINMLKAIRQNGIMEAVRL